MLAVEEQGAQFPVLLLDISLCTVRENTVSELTGSHDAPRRSPGFGAVGHVSEVDPHDFIPQVLRIQLIRM